MELARDHLYIDFEYNAQAVLCASVLYCRADALTGELFSYDLRQPAQVAALAALIAHHTEAVWCSFSAMAELESLLRLGIDIRPMAVVDLFSEARQVCGSHRHYWTPRGGLLAVLPALGLPSPGDLAHKAAMRDLALSTAPDAFSTAAFGELMAYNADDVLCLPALWRRLREIHAEARTPFRLKRPIYRGQFLKALARLEHRSRGFPINKPLLCKVYENLGAVRNLLAVECNRVYDADLFRFNKATDSYSLHFKGLNRMLDGLPFRVDWETTPSGRLRSDVEYLEDLARRYDILKPFVKTVSQLSQVRDHDFRALLRDDPNHADTGYLPAAQIAMHTVTGRQQPMVRGGFILNSAPWIRLLVRPPPGTVLLYCDWAQQEVHIAAALSGDRYLAEALRSDVYLTLGRLCGMVPPDDIHSIAEQKKLYAVARDVMKVVVLGVSYGMGPDRLGLQLATAMRDRGSNLSLEGWQHQARDIMDTHRREFAGFWAYVHETTHYARLDGWLCALDGWTMFADLGSRQTRIQNFPMQANGACILRETVIRLAEHDDIELVATLHDAVMVAAPEADWERHADIVRQCMQAATRRVLKTTALPLDIPVDVKVFTHATGYVDPRGVEMFGRVMEMLDADELSRNKYPQIIEE